MACTCVLGHFSRVPLFVTPWTVAYQAPLSMGFPRLLLQGVFLTQGSNPRLLQLLHCRWILYLLSHRGSPCGQLGPIKTSSLLKPSWTSLMHPIPSSHPLLTSHQQGQSLPEHQNNLSCLVLSGESYPFQGLHQLQKPWQPCSTPRVDMESYCLATPGPHPLRSVRMTV